MNGLSLHLSPNAPWPWLALVALALIALAVWMYAFRVPPMNALARRTLMLLRAVALVLLVGWLAMPALERARPGADTRVAVLVDRSLSMEQAERPGGGTRADAAARAVERLQGALRGRARVEVVGFASTLLADTVRDEGARSSSAPGTALAALARRPAGQRPDGVIVVSDGGVNAGDDPVALARRMGVPVHTVLVGERAGLDRGIAGVEASSEARVGEPTPVRVRVVSDEERGTPIGVSLRDGDRVLATATVPAPGPGAEAVAELRVTPARAGLALWSARVDSLAGDVSPLDDAHGVAVPVAPGRLGVLVVSAGLHWDLTFLRRALAGDSTLALETRVREGGGWRSLERGRGVPLAPGDLATRAVVVLDGVSPAELGSAFDAALGAFVRGGGGLVILPGGGGGLVRYARGALAGDLTFATGAFAAEQVAPEPQPAGAEVHAWDDDPLRGARAWREAAPLRDVAAIVPGGADRVLVAGRDGAAPLWLARTVGRGQVLLVNGTGLWRWSLSSHDDLAAERGRRLWRRAVRWVSQPVGGEPLRVTPERRLFAGGEPVRLDAILQDEAFRPVTGAELRGEATGPGGALRRFAFVPGGAGAYTATLPSPGPGRWQVTVRAERAGREPVRARSEFVVDRWTLEGLRPQPDSAALAALAGASGGSATRADGVEGWARALDPRALARPQRDTVRLWESPWLFALVVALLSVEWMWRRRRGLM